MPTCSAAGVIAAIRPADCPARTVLTKLAPPLDEIPPLKAAAGGVAWDLRRLDRLPRPPLRAGAEARVETRTSFRGKLRAGELDDKEVELELADTGGARGQGGVVLVEGEPGMGKSRLCAEFGISRKTGYKIFDRYKDYGAHGLTDRSRRPGPGWSWRHRTATPTASLEHGPQDRRHAGAALMIDTHALAGWLRGQRRCGAMADSVKPGLLRRCRRWAG